MSDAPPLDLAILEDHGTVHILLAGELDFLTGPRLRSDIAELLGDPRVRRIDVDTALLDFCDSAGLGAFITAQRMAAHHGVPLRLTQVRPRLQRLLAVTGLHGLLTAT